jgi:hypothetical protein
MMEIRLFKVTERITCSTEDGRRVIVEMHQIVETITDLDGKTEVGIRGAKHPKLIDGTPIRYGDGDGVFILSDGTIIRAE